MADIRELVPTFLESLSHKALCYNRKRETLDACIVCKSLSSHCDCMECPMRGKKRDRFTDAWFSLVM